MVCGIERCNHFFELYKTDGAIFVGSRNIFGLTNRDRLIIIYLTREPMTRCSLAAGKILLKNSALSYQDEGTIFYGYYV